VNEAELNRTDLDKFYMIRRSIPVLCENALKQVEKLLLFDISGGERHFYEKDIAVQIIDYGNKRLFEVVSGESIDLAEARELSRYLLLRALASVPELTNGEIARRSGVGEKSVQRFRNGHFEQVADYTQVRIVNTLVQLTRDRTGL
jgi:hypothetical protein